MIRIEGDFISTTPKVRKSGGSLIIGLDKGDCELLGITSNSKIQIFFRKVGDIPQESKKEEWEREYKAAKEKEGKLPKETKEESKTSDGDSGEIYPAPDAPMDN